MNSVINYSSSHRSKPLRLSFIFRTQMKSIFSEIWVLSVPLMIAYTTTTFNVQKGIKTSSMWLQWLDNNFMKWCKLCLFFLTICRSQTHSQCIYVEMTWEQTFKQYNPSQKHGTCYKQRKRDTICKLHVLNLGPFFNIIVLNCALFKNGVHTTRKHSGSPVNICRICDLCWSEDDLWTENFLKLMLGHWSHIL